MRVLGIETSCDETGIAIYDNKIGLLANQLYSQTKLHSYYGGVVPELASRDHIRKIIPLIKATLKQANLNNNDINAIAYTAGPGLVGSLLVGATIGHSLAFAWQIPAIPINHMEGHLLSPMLGMDMPSFPFIALLISGGHTQLINAIEIGRYQLLGESIDDAVGEAFDKTAKLLGLKYPGGAELSLIAKHGKIGRFIFPRPMINHHGLNFSFSGLKTFAANTIRKNKIDLQTTADIALAFENAVIDILIIKCKRALKKMKSKYLIVTGGVSANYTLRLKMSESIKKIGGQVFYTKPEFCTDNGAMIALTGMIRINDIIKNNLEINIKPRWSLTDLSPLIKNYK